MLLIHIWSIEMGEQNVNVMSSEASITNITSNNIIDGLYKIYDEAVVNSRDHATRTKGLKGNGNHPVSYIDIGITEEGVITIINDGNGIDVAEP